jgi:tRNA U38,U39,U40 pseudouridine synthase TruA
MVRALVGTMLERDPDEIVELLQGAPRSAAGSTAAPGGLYFVGVRYDPAPSG